MALGWIGSTTAFGDVVRKEWASGKFGNKWQCSGIMLGLEGTGHVLRLPQRTFPEALGPFLFLLHS